MSLLLLFNRNRRFIDFDFLPEKKKHETKIIESEVIKLPDLAKDFIERFKKQKRDRDSLKAMLEAERARLSKQLNELKLIDLQILLIIRNMDIAIAQAMAKQAEEEDLLLLLSLL